MFESLETRGIDLPQNSPYITKKKHDIILTKMEKDYSLKKEEVDQLSLQLQEKIEEHAATDSSFSDLSRFFHDLSNTNVRIATENSTL
jgi:hypothetical protein